MAEILKIREITIDTMQHKDFNVKEEELKLIRFYQNDLNSAKLLINVTHDKVVTDFSSAISVQIAFLKPDCKRVFQDVQNVNQMQGKYYVVLSTQTLIADGNVIAQLRFTFPNNKVIETCKFAFTVDESIMSDDAMKSTNEFPVIQKAIEAGKKLEGVDIDGIIAAGELAKGAVPKTGGTMTGHLGLDRANSSTILDVRWKTAGVDEILLGQDAAGNWRAFNSKLGKSFFVYAKDSDTFNINANNTNVVKKTEVYTNLVKPDGGCISISNTDLDNLKAPGFYSGYTLGNAPAGITGTLYVDVTMHTPTYIKQEATTATAPTIQKYTRELINNVWSPWQKSAREDDVVTKVKDGTVNLPITSDFTPTSSTVQNIVRRGNTVTLMLDVTRNANSTSPIVTTLPEGLRPVGSLTTDIAATDGTMSRLLIRFNGEIHLDTIGKRYRILQTFVTA
ncbi:BppU family phage baseplate upper protein [Bacillus pretiosus]|uniref:BppU family phage baseplate upper protein n=1 Tax=Bacillus pretiosus TaxID=2983392 RepID=UPI002ED94AF9